MYDQLLLLIASTKPEYVTLKVMFGYCCLYCGREREGEGGRETNHIELESNTEGVMFPRVRSGSSGFRTNNCPARMISNGQQWFKWVRHRQTTLNSSKIVLQA